MSLEMRSLKAIEEEMRSLKASEEEMRSLKASEDERSSEVTRKNIIKQLIHKMKNNDKISEAINSFIFRNVSIELAHKAKNEMYNTLAETVLESLQSLTHVNCNIS